MISYIDTAESRQIYLLGDVTEFELQSYVSFEGTPQKVDLFVSSYGGEVDAAFTLRNLLLQFVEGGGDLTVHALGTVASAAVLLFTIPSSRRVAERGCLFYVHNAWVYTAGDAEELRETAEMLEKYDGMIIDAYKAVIAEGTNIPQLLSDDTWMNTETAKELGLIDDIMDGDSSIQSTDADGILNSSKLHKVCAKANPYITIEKVVEVEVEKVVEVEVEKVVEVEKPHDTSRYHCILHKLTEAIDAEDDAAKALLEKAIDDESVDIESIKINSGVAYIPPCNSLKSLNNLWARAGLK